MIIKKIIFSVAALFSAMSISAQVENAGAVRKSSDKKEDTRKETGLTDRMKQTTSGNEAHDADLTYMREIYRDLDLTKGPNSPLYYPEDVINGQENLFRIILRLVTEGKIPAYEYLDGREIFTDNYKINVGDMLQRFDIYATEAKGSTEKNPRFTVEESDVPVSQLQNYFILEKWEFDTRSNRMKTKIMAICPVLGRYADFGGETKYPMFWIKYEDLRPYLLATYVFTSDDNNLATHTIDDFFSLGMYDGEIYKFKNLRNLSMAQMFLDEDDRKHAQDSIDNRLRSYGKHLWVPTREEYLAMKEAQEANLGNGESDSIPDRTIVENGNASLKKVSAAKTKKRSTTKKRSAPKTSTVKSKTVSTENTNAAKSVRRRKR